MEGAMCSNNGARRQQQWLCRQMGWEAVGQREGLGQGWAAKKNKLHHNYPTRACRASYLQLPRQQFRFAFLHRVSSAEMLISTEN